MKKYRKDGRDIKWAHKYMDITTVVPLLLQIGSMLLLYYFLGILITAISLFALICLMTLIYVYNTVITTLWGDYLASKNGIDGNGI